MADLPISQLPELTAVTSNSQFAVEESGVTYRVKTPFISNGNLYGAFVSLTTQTASSTTVAYSMSANTVTSSNGVTVVDGCKFTVPSGGTYNIQFSAQIESTGGGNSQIMSIWLSKNGSNVAYSNTSVTTNSNNGKQVAAWNFVEPNYAGGYYELKWSISDTRMQISYQGDSIDPIRPAIPSVIVTVTQV